MSPLDELEALLRHAEQAGGAFAPEACAASDRLEAFPQAACQLLAQFGLSSFYVPALHGGRLESFAELVQLWRAVAARDLTVAVAHGKTFLGTVCVWVAGDARQASRIGQAVCEGLVVSWGLTERHHGSDLLAGEMCAVRAEGGWRVDGEKWLINNATRGQVLCALVRTDPAGGPRGFSLFLMDKRGLADEAYECLPKESLHGIRGADISGIRYHGALVGQEAMVGKPGQGVEIVLKGLQLSRTACAALSLGAADAALKLAHDFCAQRQVQGRCLLSLPLVRRQLSDIASGLAVAEAVSIVASRSTHALTGEMSVIAPLTKALVPAIVDELVSNAGDMLGARAFLLDEWAHGRFQKLERDHRIVAIFDGSTVVNRNGLINQFRLLARAWLKRQVDTPGLACACDVKAPLPPWRSAKLSLLASAGCSVLQSWPQAVSQLGQLALKPDELGQAAARVMPTVQALDAAIHRVMNDVAQCLVDGRDVPPEAFELAAEVEQCFAAAACLQLWLHNAPAQAGQPWWQGALWLRAALLRLLNALLPNHGVGDSPWDELADQLVSKDGRVSLLADWTSNPKPQQEAA